MFKMSEKVDKIGAALISARLEILNPTKSAVAHKYKYADINSVLDSIITPCLNHGILVQQHIESCEKFEFSINTFLLHPESNQYIMSLLKISPEMNTTGRETPIKELGGAITYMKRYALMSIFALAGDEDDADKPTNSHHNKQKNDRVISSPQLSQILSLVEGNDKWIKYICSKFSVSDIHLIREDDFKKVIEMIEFHKNKQAQ